MTCMAMPMPFNATALQKQHIFKKKAITFEQLEELFPNHHGLQRSPMRPQFPRRLVWFLTVWTGGVKAAQEMI